MLAILVLDDFPGSDVAQQVPRRTDCKKQNGQSPLCPYLGLLWLAQAAKPWRKELKYSKKKNANAKPFSPRNTIISPLMRLAETLAGGIRRLSRACPLEGSKHQHAGKVAELQLASKNQRFSGSPQEATRVLLCRVGGYIL